MTSYNKIKHSNLFKGLTPEQGNLLNEICYEETHEEGTIIFRVDQAPNFLYFVVEGQLKLTFPDGTYLIIGPSEFIGEIGVLNGSFRLGELSATQFTNVVKLNGDSLFKENLIPPSLALLLVKRMAESATNYFRSLQNFSSKELISRGESNNVEFKSSLRWNYKAAKKDKAMEFTVLKTIAAFLNSIGGHLFVGVDDDGQVLGLEKDGFLNEDKYLLHITALIKSKISANHLQFISMQIETIDHRQFLRIDCVKSLFPAFLQNNDQEFFYIRTGPSTTSLKISQAINYISDNFSKTIN